ncbi:phage baseplate assembly protein V [Vibrio sp. TBV020]|uniref:phage baseplate assembly protein V n=1 Tax=Vibrio sp. TBV020 TaxID=3137398 RepID=UPI0038CD5C35
MSEFTQAQLVRRISQMIQIGTIKEVQAKPLRYVVQYTPELETDLIPANVGHAGNVKDFAPLQVGEQVVVVKEFDTQGGVILGSLNQESNDQPKDDLNLFYREFPDGTWLQYDMEQHVLSGFINGKVSLEAKNEIMLKSPKIKMIGDIEHDGSQKTTGDISDGVRSMAADREIYNGHDHPHGDPVVGKVNQKQ